VTGSPDVVVVGAGVMGLTTAIRLCQAGASTRIVAASPPAATTSALATAMVGPTFELYGERVSKWEADTVAALSSERAPGVHRCRGRFLARPSGLLPPGAERLPGFEPCRDDERPDGFATGFWSDVLLVDMPPYLEHLEARFTALGGTVEDHTLGSVDDAFRFGASVVNCSGIGARDLVPDPEVTPMRGPKVVVENPGIDTFVMVGPPGPEGTSIHPHGDLVVLGGSARASDDTTPDADEEAAIVSRCAALEPRLHGVRVLEHRVGLRPSRPAIRLDVEDRGGGRVVHNYGHGGIGVTVSWGCAADAAALISH
jgi:D-amino-acid oxidase